MTSVSRSERGSCTHRQLPRAFPDAADGDIVAPRPSSTPLTGSAPCRGPFSRITRRAARDRLSAPEDGRAVSASQLTRPPHPIDRVAPGAAADWPADGRRSHGIVKRVPLRRREHLNSQTSTDAVRGRLGGRRCLRHGIADHRGGDVDVARPGGPARVPQHGEAVPRARVHQSRGPTVAITSARRSPDHRRGASQRGSACHKPRRPHHVSTEDLARPLVDHPVQLVRARPRATGRRSARASATPGGRQVAEWASDARMWISSLRSSSVGGLGDQAPVVSEKARRIHCTNAPRPTRSRSRSGLCWIASERSGCAISTRKPRISSSHNELRQPHRPARRTVPRPAATRCR